MSHLATNQPPAPKHWKESTLDHTTSWKAPLTGLYFHFPLPNLDTFCQYDLWWCLLAQLQFISIEICSLRFVLHLLHRVEVNFPSLFTGSSESSLALRNRCFFCFASKNIASPLHWLAFPGTASFVVGNVFKVSLMGTETGKAQSWDLQIQFASKATEANRDVFSAHFYGLEKVVA